VAATTQVSVQRCCQSVQSCFSPSLSKSRWTPGGASTPFDRVLPISKREQREKRLLAALARCLGFPKRHAVRDASPCRGCNDPSVGTEMLSKCTVLLLSFPIQESMDTGRYKHPFRSRLTDLQKRTARKEASRGPSKLLRLS